MKVEARVTKIWKNQKLLLVVLLLGFCVAFLFDGLVRYPRLNAQFRKHEEFVKAGDLKGWEAFAAKEGWNATPPEKIHSEVEQFVFAGITGVLGAIALVFWITQRGRILRMDDSGVSVREGEVIPFGAITGVDAAKWKSKGIARVKYQIDGRAGQFVLDDYKFEANATREIFKEIEKRRSADAAE